MELNPIELANSQVTPIKELETFIQSQSPYTENNQKENEFLKTLTGDNDLAGGASMQPKKQKLSMTDEVSIMETSNLASDGDWIAKYPTYKIGRDNAEYAAQNQDNWDKWANGLTKASANFATTVVGNTVGIVYGAANGVKEGSWNAVFDNNFSNALADWNEKLGYQLPNYVTQQEKDASLLGSLGTTNFWANDVAGAFSFTLGTIASEAIWALSTGGSANIAKAGLKGAQTARWSKSLLGEARTLKGIADYKAFLGSGTRKLFTKTDDVLAMTNNAINKSTRAKWLNTARFLATTSGNEAGIEALHYKREQQDNFYENFAKQNGREPSEEEIATFNNDLENSANLVFASNMAILAPSNLAMFGGLFNISSPFRGVSKSINKSLFGVGVEKSAEGIYQGVVATGKQKAGRIAYVGLKPLVTEGIWEEGLQGVTTKSAENWITSTFDPKYNNESMALSQATAKAFGEQYGTKEGWKEMLIGMIVGGGTSLVIGKGKFQELREFEKAQEYQDSYVAKGLNQFGDNSSTASILFAQKMMLNSRIKSATDKQAEAVKKGDDVGVMLAQQEPLIAEIQFKKAIGEDSKELIAKYETALNSLPQESWNEVGIEDIEEYKKSVLNGYKSLIANHEKASDFADAILGETRVLGQNVQTQLLKDALTYSILSGQTANKAMDITLQDMSKIIGDDSKAKSIQAELQRLGKNKQEQVRKTNIKVNQAENEVKALTNELQRLQVSKDETKGERLQKVQAKLTESLDKVNQLKEEREKLAQDVSQEIKRRSTLEDVAVDEISLTSSSFISGEDLATIEEKLKRIESTIKSYEGVNHQVYYDLLDLQKQYNSAKEKFFSYQNSIDAIVSGQFAPKFSKVEGVLGKIFGQKESIDDFTSEFLTEINNNYQNSLGRTGVELEIESQYISDEDYELFKNTGEVSDEIKQKLSERVKTKELLSEREKEIYSILTQEINDLTISSLNPNKPNLNPIVEVETLSEAEKLRKDLANAMQVDYPLITTDVDELLKEKPTQEEVDRYANLYKKIKRLDLFEQKEFEELQPRMQKWFMAQSLPSLSGMSVADVVELIEQLETQIDKEQTITEITVEDILESTESNDARALNRVDILQNLSGSAVTKVQDGKIYFAQIDVRNIIGKLLSEGVNIAEIKTVNKEGKLTKEKQLTPALLNQNYNVVGTEFKIGEIKINVGERGNIVMTLEDYNKSKDVINLYYFDSKTGKWSWSDLYEEYPDGSKRKKQSEYNTNTNSETIYNSEQGDDLNLFVDMNIDWNQNLVDESFQEVAQNDELSEELKDKIRKTLEITSKKDRENNSTMKATGKDTSDDNFMLIRKRFSDKFIELVQTEGVATLPKKIDLNIEVPISEMFLGTPDFVLDASNTPIEFAITKRGTEEVISQGYVLGQETILADKKVKVEEVSRLFVSNLAKANPEAKIPVVLLKKGKHQFVFPISLVKTTENQVEKLNSILEKEQDFIQTRKEVNNLMISLGLNTRLVSDSDMQLEDIRKELEQYTTFRTADELANAEYDKNNLISDATIKIDLEDTLISSPKITVDYSKAVIGTSEENENGAIELRNDIIKDMIEIRKIVNNSPEIPDQSRFVNAFADNDIENQGTDIMNRKDVNFMRKTFFNQGNKIPIQDKDIAVKTIGKERLLKLRSKLEMLNFYEEQIKTAKDKATLNKLNCK